MTDEKDEKDLDPSDWLASQFDPTEAVPVQPPAAAPPVTPPPVAAPPVVPPPVVAPPVSAPPVVPPPVSAPPAAPPGTPPPLVTPPAGASFTWGLQPGGESTPPQPTVPDLPPTEAIPSTDAPTQAFTPVTPAGQDLEPKSWEPWHAEPVDASLDGVNDVVEAEIIGLDAPEGESNPQSPIDDLFGDTKFQDYEGEPLITGPPPSDPQSPAAPAARAPMPRGVKILLWVAGGLVALLALLALFMLGQRLASAPAPAPSPTATTSSTPTATPSPVALPAGPVAPGEYAWDELLGGECLAPYESAWQERYTVVDCGTPHPAQMVFRGQFDDAADAPYPGFDELGKRIGLLCTAPTVINYQVAGTAQDIQVAASFAVDAADWDGGNRTYFCFANRASGAELTASIAQPQPAP